MGWVDARRRRGLAARAGSSGTTRRTTRASSARRFERRGFAVDVALVDDELDAVELDGIDVLGVLGSKWSVYDHDRVGAGSTSSSPRSARPTGAGSRSSASASAPRRCASRWAAGGRPRRASSSGGCSSSAWSAERAARGAVVPVPRRPVPAAGDGEGAGAQRRVRPGLRVGAHLGVQFHPELDAGQLSRWFAAGADREAAAAGVSPAALARDRPRSTRLSAAVRVDRARRGRSSNAPADRRVLQRVAGVRGDRGATTCAAATASSPPWTASALRSRPAPAPRCSDRTARARRRPSRSWRATGGATAATSRVLGGDPATADRAWRERLGIVPQDCNDLLELTVAESVGYFSTLYPTPRDPHASIELVGLSEKARRAARRPSPAGSDAGWTSRSGSSATPSCSSSTSRRRASTPRRGGPSGS